MKSQKRGKNTLKPNLHTTPEGIWVLVDQYEYFLPYKDYPWFYSATLKDIYDFHMESPQHLRWPSLDIDLDLDSLKNPSKYPLVYRP